MSGLLQSCCCGQAGCERDCIWQAEIESGCCHKDDTLLLWCERPGFQNTTRFVCNPSPFNSGTETCCVVSQPAQDPIQAIYHYHACYYRCIPAQGISNPFADIVSPPEQCPADACWYDFSQTPIVPTPCAAYADCVTGAPTCSCNNPFVCPAPTQSGCCSNIANENCVTCCACNDPLLNQWRRDRMSVKDQWKWAVEMICHKNGTDMSANPACQSIGGYSQCQRLGALGTAHQCLCVVHFERWWKIAETCDFGVRIYVPGCSQTITETNCGGTVCQTDDLVPKWWIFACSGCPLYAGDLIDAVRFGVITSGEAADFLTKLFSPCQHPDQGVLVKLAKAGYIRANDWRDEQRKAFQELHLRFPGAGYDACIQNVGDMHTLGPFRKRMTFATVGTSNQPILKQADLVADPDLGPLQADCFIDYPGNPANQADYDYWSQRQWVYFRGRPGGWTWACWNSGASCAGAGSSGAEDEIIAILNGIGRGSPGCIKALAGESCRNPPTSTPCACCNTDPELDIECIGCGIAPCSQPISGCSPPEICLKFNAQPFCEGIRFRYFVYASKSTYVPPNDCCDDGSGRCCLCDKIECLYTMDSYLVGAKRSRDSWLDKVPFTCRDENPPLPVFKAWSEWSKTHALPLAAICNLHANPGNDTKPWCWNCGPNCFDPCPSSEYSDRACCGGFCPADCGCNPKTWEPVTQISDNCPASDACPPHDTPAQISCVGHSINCTE